jgi:hypothetical protein
MTSWEDQILRAAPSVVVLEGFNQGLRAEFWTWLVTQGYHRWFVGQFRVLVRPEARFEAAANGIQLTPRPTRWPEQSDGAAFTQDACGIG